MKDFTATLVSCELQRVPATKESLADLEDGHMNLLCGEAQDNATGDVFDFELHFPGDANLDSFIRD